MALGARPRPSPCITTQDSGTDTTVEPTPCGVTAWTSILARLAVVMADAAASGRVCAAVPYPSAFTVQVAAGVIEPSRPTATSVHVSGPVIFDRVIVRRVPHASLST